MVLLCLFSISAYTCPRALPTNDPNFCPSFKTAATCYCSDSGLPKGMCEDMNQLYLRLIVVFGTLDKACEFQQHTTKRDCLDNWNCYLHGGTDSTAKSCSSTGQPCP